jgi:hypothetical protein
VGEIGSHGSQGIMDRPTQPNDAQCTSQEQPRNKKKLPKKIIQIQIRQTTRVVSFIW